MLKIFFSGLVLAATVSFGGASPKALLEILKLPDQPSDRRAVLVGMRQVCAGCSRPAMIASLKDKKQVERQLAAATATERFQKKAGVIKVDFLNPETMVDGRPFLRNAADADELLANRTRLASHPDYEATLAELKSRGLNGPYTRAWNSAELSQLKAKGIEPKGERLGFPFLIGYVGHTVDKTFNVESRKYDVKQGWVQYSGKVYKGDNDTDFNDTGVNEFLSDIDNLRKQAAL